MFYKMVMLCLHFASFSDAVRRWGGWRAEVKGGVATDTLTFGLQTKQ